MAYKDMRGRRLPPDHPFACGLILSVPKRAGSSTEGSAPSPAPAGEDYEIERLGITIPADDPMLEGIKAHEEYMKARSAEHRAKRGTTDPSKPKPSE